MEKFYELSDFFMLRTPSLFKDIINEVDNNIDNIEKIIEGKNLKSFLKELLIISSKETYQTYLKENTNIKSKFMLNKTIKNYLSRASSRPTPYGICAGVSLLNYSEESNSNNVILDSESFFNHINVDSSWLYKLIILLQNKDEIRKNISVSYNKNLFKSGDRIKSIQMSNYLMEEKKEYGVFSIKNNKLIDLVIRNTENFISRDLLYKKIKECYPDVENKIIDDFINNLIQNEVLLTNLLPSAYYENSLEDLIYSMKELNPNDNLVKKLTEINDLIEMYNKKNDKEKIVDIVNKMSEIVQNENYISCVRGFRTINSGLDLKIKTDLSDFINTITRYKLKIKNRRIEEFKYKFIDAYSYNTLVKLMDLFDSNKFEINNIYDDSEIDFSDFDEESNEFINCIECKILEAIQNGKDEIYISKDDLNILKKNENTFELINSFDINIIIKKMSNDNYEYILAPNSGSHRAGAMFNRFANVLDKDKYGEVLSKIKSEDSIIESSECSNFTEIRELNNNTRIQNIKSQTLINNSVLPLCLNTKNQNEVLSLNDIYIRINYNNEFELININNNKKIKFVSNDMLNVKTKSNISKFLYSITNEEIDPMNIFSYIVRNRYIYIPRIKFENFVVRPKTWNIYEGMVDLSSIELFRKSLNRLIKVLNINKFVYITKYDNRLLLNITNIKNDDYLYKIFKREKNIILEEYEYDDESQFMVEDELNRKYYSEFTFSAFKSRKLESNSKNDRNVSCIDMSNDLYPLEEGWLYIKIYSYEGRENDILAWLEDINVSTGLKNFFIRYKDDIGYHIRFRININSNEKEIFNILKKCSYLKENKISKRIIIDTYFREVNRYGGEKVINDIEELFCIDSSLIYKINKVYNLNSEESMDDIFFIGIIEYLKAFYDNKKKMYIDLCKYVNDDNDDNYKYIYDRDRNKYRKLFEKIYYENFKYDSEISALLEKRYHQSLKVKNKIKENNITNDYHNIVFSVIHMYCNRIKGENLLEDMYLSVIKYSLRDLIRKEEHLHNKK
ncbi:thiopeptide-type bacteriocin biosynthesis protein [Peptostreptococcus sp. D1]|uniref:thiopeptide-type bacteriocin biosynthesis protein n=1 Tax=Peptostreptococcus sp. D1 TaxID=72304 RepID=UPI0008EACC2B|nr:thiopeptide-type bacteriocin biosynthesis protein [Peptostreptococcus sp. D1]SFE66922.1 thiopeptide-type bacteriocin biosynthesis domain-containing protein [Peptostreptococcus sp. D1]